MDIQENKTVVIHQTLLLKVEDEYQMAEKYYSILSTVNNLKLTTRQIQLVAFTAIRGNISYSTIKEDFCKKFNSSSATINNMIGDLRKMKVFVKDGSKIKVNPVILLNFKNNMKIDIKIEHGSFN